MSEIENIVPPVDLCKKIPEGEFRNTALVWETYFSKHNIKPVVIDRETSESTPHEFVENVYPAPTLEEILEAIGAVETWNTMTITRITGGKQSLTTNALKRWFKAKGIEVER